MDIQVTHLATEFVRTKYTLVDPENAKACAVITDMCLREVIVEFSTIVAEGMLPGEAMVAVDAGDIMCETTAA